MTKEEADFIGGMNMCDEISNEAYKKIMCYCEEQEPCEDAISRQSAIFLASDLKQDLPDDERIADMVMAHNDGILEYQTQLSLLPPVTPQPKTGRWIEVDTNMFACSNCRHCFCIVPEDNSIKQYNYCPNCGAKMVEPQERSDKE